MMIYFADRDLDILGNASTQLPDGFRISQDQTVEEIDTGVNTFSCVISYTQDDRADLEPMVAEGNYILKQSARGDDDNAYDAVYQIIEVECDTNAQEYQVYAEDAGLDLLNTLCPAVSLSGNVWQMMNWFLPSNWTINLIDAPISTKTYTWDGESTCTERLLSVAGLWDCEIFYSFIIDRLQIKQRVVNVTKHRGNQEAIPQLRLNYDLKKIYWKRSIADLVTALNVTGGTPEGSETPINLKGYSYSYTDPATGDVYRVDTATGQMRNTTAMGRWSSAIDPDGLWVGSFQFDTTDKATLAGEARAYLQRHSQVEVNYEVDFEKLPDDIQIGDRVNIIDEDGELYLEARLLRIETCEAEDTQTATIGEYLLRDGGISARVSQLATDLANARATDKVIQSQMQIITDTVDNMFTLEVDSDVVLAQAHLTARLLQGNKDIKTDYDPSWFKWILRNDSGEYLLGRGYTLDVDMSIIGYASTILCKFIRPQLYDLTDHNLVNITDENLEAIQVAFAGIWNQPVPTRNMLKALRSTPTVEVGYPTVSEEVNLYERDGLADAVSLFTGNKGGYVVLKPNDDGTPQEILVMDKPTIEEATNVWRWNKEGIGYSPNGYDGEYTTAWTIDGKFNANFIQTGTLLANLIRAGTITGGAVTWDLDRGELRTENVSAGNTWGALLQAGHLTLFVDDNVAGDFTSSLNVTTNTPIASLATNQLLIRPYPMTSDYYVQFNSDNTYQIEFHKPVLVSSNFTVSGTKSREIKTDNYGKRLLFAYETPTPLFGDIGECSLDEDGICYVDIDDILQEAIADVEYQVFLQKEGQGDCWIAEKNPTYFVVQGTPNLKVAWELKAKQKGYEYARLEEFAEYL